MKPAIIVDLDGTLCNIEHRRHHVATPEGVKKDWEAFYQGIPNDTIHRWCEELVWKMSVDYHIIFVTGRPNNYINLTQDWLGRHELQWAPLLMRKEGDFRPDNVVKKEIYEIHIKDHYDVLFCVDDRQQVVDMWRELGLTCLQCDKGNF